MPYGPGWGAVLMKSRQGPCCLLLMTMWVPSNGHSHIPERGLGQVYWTDTSYSGEMLLMVLTLRGN